MNEYLTKMEKELLEKYSAKDIDEVLEKQQKLMEAENEQNS